LWVQLGCLFSTMRAVTPSAKSRDSCGVVDQANKRFSLNRVRWVGVRWCDEAVP
jgi:hypothetical protein